MTQSIIKKQNVSLVDPVFLPILESIHPESKLNLGSNELKLLKTECWEWEHNTANHYVENRTVAQIITELLWRREQMTDA